MRLEEKVNERTMSILVDTWSPHNFICEKPARHLACVVVLLGADCVDFIDDGSTVK